MLCNIRFAGNERIGFFKDFLNTSQKDKQRNHLLKTDRQTDKTLFSSVK